CDARRPSLAILRVLSTPREPGGTTNAAWPREPRSGSTAAVTTWMLAMPPLVIQAFCPLMIHSSDASSYRARVRIDDTSEPASGSDVQNAATWGSSASPKHAGTHSASCSPVPAAKMLATARLVPMIDMARPASPQNNSSLRIGRDRPVGSGQVSASDSNPYSPILAAS